MTKEEFERLIEVLRLDYEKARTDLAIKFALSNNPYKIGDIIEDHYHKIKIEYIKVYYVSSSPQCLYTGVELKKDNTPTNKQSNTTMYQQNVKSKIEI